MNKPDLVDVLSTKENLTENNDGVLVTKLNSWVDFHQCIMKLIAKGNYIWRGQTKDKALKSSFDRNIPSGNKKNREELLEHHIDNFKMEMTQSHPNVLPKNEDEIWALGQHYGLETPMLDWTMAPYIAAYFAFKKQVDPDNDDGYRYVYALKRSLRRLMSNRKERYVAFIDQLTHPSPRFSAQKGVFTKALNGIDIETNIRSFSKKRPNEVTLVKFTIPREYRDECLRELHLMNINHTSLLLDFRDVVDRCNSKRRDCDPTTG